MKTVDELLKGCEHDGSYIPVSEVKRILQECMAQFPAIDLRGMKEAMLWAYNLNAGKSAAQMDVIAYNLETIFNEYLSTRKDIDRTEVKTVSDNINANEPLPDCNHNQFCDKQTTDLHCMSKSGCNFKT